MSTIGGSNSIGAGVQAASHALRAAQTKFTKTSAEITRSAALASNQGYGRPELTRSSTPSVSAKSELGAPPNPGPPGGATPADLTALMQNQDNASLEISANVKTLQAFDEMLAEVTRLKPPTS